jgi:hypothetical protein
VILLLGLVLIVVALRARRGLARVAVLVCGGFTAWWLASHVSLSDSQLTALAVGAVAIGVFLNRYHLYGLILEIRRHPLVAITAAGGFLVGITGGQIVFGALVEGVARPGALLWTLPGVVMMLLGQWLMAAPARDGSLQQVVGFPYRLIRDGLGAVRVDSGLAVRVVVVMGVGAVAALAVDVAGGHPVSSYGLGRWAGVLAVGALSIAFLRAADLDFCRDNRRELELLAQDGLNDVRAVIDGAAGGGVRRPYAWYAEEGR